jgi:hypothetical protein
MDNVSLYSSGADPSLSHPSPRKTGAGPGTPVAGARDGTFRGDKACKAGNVYTPRKQTRPGAAVPHEFRRGYPCESAPSAFISGKVLVLLGNTKGPIHF